MASSTSMPQNQRTGRNPKHWMEPTVVENPTLSWVGGDQTTRKKRFSSTGRKRQKQSWRGCRITATQKPRAPQRATQVRNDIKRKKKKKLWQAYSWHPNGGGEKQRSPGRNEGRAGRVWDWAPDGEDEKQEELEKLRASQIKSLKDKTSQDELLVLDLRDVQDAWWRRSTSCRMTLPRKKSKLSSTISSHTTRKYQSIKGEWKDLNIRKNQTKKTFISCVSCCI